MSEKIVIIGGGIAGYTLALELIQHNVDLTLIEKDVLGGVCLNRGCIPTKLALHHSSNKVALKEIINKIKDVTSTLRNQIEFLIKSNKIKYINDEAKIKSIDTIFLKNSGNCIKFDKLILATGSMPYIPDSFKNIADVITTNDILNLNEIPEEFVIIGGGYIGVEFATLFNRLGSNVTIIEKEDSLLPSIDKDLSISLKKAFENNGINIFVGKEIKKFEENVIYLEDGKEILYNKILLAIGRVPSGIDSDIPLEKENNCIKVDYYFETSQKNIFMIGDSIGSNMLAHKAEYDAKILANNLVNETKQKPDYSKIPFCIFSDPQIGIIGEIEEESIKIPFTSLGKSYCDESTCGFLKLGIDKNKKLTGALVINKNGVEVLSAIIPIINIGLTCEEISKMVFAHPTSCEIIKKAAIKALKLRG